MRASPSFELAMEDADRTVPPRLQPGADLLRQRDRAVESARAPDPDREPRLSLGEVRRQGQVEELLHRREEPARERLVQDVRPDAVRQAGEPSQLGDVAVSYTHLTLPTIYSV